MTRLLRFLRSFLHSAPDYRVRADLNAHEERRQRILGLFAERAGGNQPTVIEGEFSVVEHSWPLDGMHDWMNPDHAKGAEKISQYRRTGGF